MSNPDSSTPSIQALDKAVKPAGYRDWAEFKRNWHGAPEVIALAYAADLDKADKVAKAFERVAEKGMIDFPVEQAVRLREEVRSMRLPEDPDLLEAQSEYGSPDEQTIYLHGIRRGRELAKEQDRG